jgi:hypothetical protein
MAIADMIPTLNDASLANLRTNASKLEATGNGPRQREAALLLPLIDAELATRLANKPKAVRAAAKPKAVGVAKPKAAPKPKKAAKVKVEAEAEELEE